MQGVTYEEFAAALGAMSQAEIRRQLEQGYGISLPSKVGNKEELIKLAWSRITAPDQPKEPTGATLSPAPEAAAGAAAAPAAARPQEPADKRYKVRCVGVPKRWRCGRCWFPARADVTENEFTAEQWAELKADGRIEVREVE